MDMTAFVRDIAALISITAFVASLGVLSAAVQFVM
jgi:hypothetical protein